MPHPLAPSPLGEGEIRHLGDTPRAPIEIQRFRWELTQAPAKGDFPPTKSRILWGPRICPSGHPLFSSLLGVQPKSESLIRPRCCHQW